MNMLRICNVTFLKIQIFMSVNSVLNSNGLGGHALGNTHMLSKDTVINTANPNFEFQKKK